MNAKVYALECNIAWIQPHNPSCLKQDIAHCGTSSNTARLSARRHVSRIRCRSDGAMEGMNVSEGRCSASADESSFHHPKMRPPSLATPSTDNSSCKLR